MDNNELKNIFWDILCIVKNLKNEDELFLFFRDLLSESEMVEFAKRLQVAKTSL